MQVPTIALTCITIVAHDLPAVAHFYHRVLAARLRPLPVYRTTFYDGSLAGVGFRILPAELAPIGVGAGRHHLKFQISQDVEQLKRAIVEAGGLVTSDTIPDPAQGLRLVLASDPDGNLLEFAHRISTSKE